MKIGDHIKVHRKSPVPYWHHGIYIGGRKVIHFTGDIRNIINAEVKITSLEEFCQGNRYIFILKHSNCYSPELTLKIAKAFQGEKNYHLLENNCEHFANFCKKGDKKSEQAETVKMFGMFFTGVLLTLVGVFAFKKLGGVA